MKQVLVSQDEILISESGGFDFSRYEGMIADTINAITDDLRKNITDDSSSIRELKEIITGLKGNLDKISSKVAETKESISTLEKSQSNKITSLESKFDKNKAETISKIEAISSPESSIASKLDELKSKVNNNSADIILLQQGTTTETGSIATQLSTLKAKIENSHAELTSKIDANATNDTASANEIKKLTTRINDLNANYSNSLNTSVSQLQGKITTITQKTETLETKINNQTGNALSNYTSQIEAIARQEAGKVTSVNASKISSLESSLNGTRVKIDQTQQSVVDLNNWKSSVAHKITDPIGNQTGFEFGTAYGEKSYFNIHARNINLVSNGKKIIGVQNGVPYIDGSVIRMDNADFYETQTAPVPRTKFEPNSKHPHVYTFWFQPTSRGFYLIATYRADAYGAPYDYIGITHVGYHAHVGQKVRAELVSEQCLASVQFKLYRYGL